MNEFNYEHDQLLDFFEKAYGNQVSQQHYGVVGLSPTSLMFDRANEGNPFHNDFVFAQLPVEITWQIVQWIPRGDLASLALVNTDCRQLARSRQFSTISLDYSQRASDLLEALCQEGKERLSNSGYTRRPALGACVQHITIRTNPYCIRSRHHLMPGSESLDLETPNGLKRLDEACTMFFGKYLSQIASILSDRTILPHLRFLEWHDTYPIHQATMRAIITSGARDIILRRMKFDESFTLHVLLLEYKSVIKSLDMSLSWNATYPDEGRGRLAPLISNILHLVAPTIESLVWSGYHSEDYQPSPNVQAGSRPFFPHLQELCLQFETEYDPIWLDLLICPGQQSPIRSLEIGIAMFPSANAFFQNCGKLPLLETLVLAAYGKEVVDLSFLKSNSHIKKFGIFQTVRTECLENRILPLLSEHFHNLKSLRIELIDTSISYQALASISRISSLSQLYIGVGGYGQSAWLVDHNALRASLHALSNLQKLVLCWDAYTVSPGLGYAPQDLPAGPAHLAYYYLRRPRTYHELLGVSQQDEDTDNTQFKKYVIEKWEEQHRHDMVTIVEQYASVIPSLEWMHVGQLPMSIKHDENGRNRVTILSDGRTNCSWLFDRMFGRKNSQHRRWG